MTETIANNPRGSEEKLADSRLTALLALRSEKWDRIKHLDSLDSDLLKVYVSLMGALGALVVWLAGKYPGSADQLTGTLGLQQMVGIGTVFLLLSVYCIASVLRNYVNYLRALVVVSGVETEMHRLGLPWPASSVQFRPPLGFWSFLRKLVKTTRGPLLAIYFSCTPAIAWAMAGFIPAARHTQWLFLGLLTPLTWLLAIAHWRSFDRVDSAGFVVLTRSTTRGDYLVAMLRSHDRKWGHPKGHRAISRFGFLEAASVTRWRELEEEIGLHCDGKTVTQWNVPSEGQKPRPPLSKPRHWRRAEKDGLISVSSYFLDTFADPEPEPWRRDKAVRLWALYVPQIVPQPREGDMFSTSLDHHAYGEWRSANEVLDCSTPDKLATLRAPYVRDALLAARMAIGRWRP